MQKGVKISVDILAVTIQINGQYNFSSQFLGRIPIKKLCVDDLVYF